MRPRFYLAVFLLLLIYGDATARQTPINVRAVHYDVRNGLIDNKLSDGVIDRIGGLWVVSPRGVSHFDGIRFINYSTKDSLYKISDDIIRDIVDHGDYVYVANKSSIDKIHIHSKQSVPHPYVHDVGYISELIITDSGQLYVLDELGILTDVQSNKKLSIGFVAIDYNHALLADQQTVIISGIVSNRISRVNLSTLQLEVTWSYDRSPGNVSRALSFVNDYGLVNLLSSGTVVLDTRNGAETPLSDVPEDLSHVEDLSAEYKLYASGFNTILRHDAGFGLRPVFVPGFEGIVIKKILTDGNRTVFILHDRGLTVFRLPPPFMATVPTNRLTYNEPNLLFKSIIETTDKKVLLLMFNNILEYDPSSDRIRNYPAPVRYYISGVLKGRTLYSSTDGTGLVAFNIDRPHTDQMLPLDPNKSNTEHSYYVFDDNGELVVGYTFPFGLWRFNLKSEQFRKIPIPFREFRPTSNGINHVSIDRSGHYWVATNQGLYELDNAWNVLRIYGDPADEGETRLGDNRVTQVLHAADGRIWVATRGGLFTREVDSVVLVEVTSFSGEIIASIEEDDFGRLWVATFHGLAVYDPKLRNVLRFYQEDGFVDNEYNIGSHLKASDATIYFGGLNGVVRIDPTKLQIRALQPVIRLSGVTVENNRVNRLIHYYPSSVEPIELDGYTDLLTVNVSFMEYINSTYSSYKYRLAGYDDEWFSFENGTLRLRKLPVGSYFIEISGTHASGAGVSESILIPVNVTQPFVRSVYFVILVVFFVVSIIAAFLYYRYTQQLALRTIRSNLLNDIHDELGGILTKAAMRTELVGAKPAIVKSDLKGIQHLHQEGIQSLRNLLWNISSEDSTTQEFQDRITDWLTLVFGETGIEFMFENKIPEAKFNLSVQQRRQLLPIIKELAVNAMKHSNGDTFRLVLDMDAGFYRITAFDNGRNNDSIIPESGFGVKGIRSRVRTLKGSVTFEKADNGFKTVILFK
jgi:sugar lactone lactonase YvrE